MIRFKMKPDCIIDGDNREGTTGEFLCSLVVNERMWAVVLIEGDSEPTLVKASRILISSIVWVDVK